MLAKEKAEEELRELSDTVEMATLDKEMAEERVGGDSQWEKREEGGREGGREGRILFVFNVLLSYMK